MHRHVVVPEVVPLIVADVRVVHGAAAEAVEMIIAALQGTVSRQNAHVPLADQRGAVSGFLQLRRQRGMSGGKTTSRTPNSGSSRPDCRRYW